jgi:hypothetical protein
MGNAAAGTHTLSYQGSLDRVMCLGCLEEEARRLKEAQRMLLTAGSGGGSSSGSGRGGGVGASYLAPIPPFAV